MSTKKKRETLTLKKKEQRVDKDQTVAKLSELEEAELNAYKRKMAQLAARKRR